MWFGAVMAVSAALAFGAVFLVSWVNLPWGESRLEMATRLLREVPAVSIVGYGCLVQVRRYRGVRNRRAVRGWFEQSLLLLSGALLLAGLLSVLFPYPILNLLEPLPPMALLIDAIWMVPLGGFSALSAFVFFEAIGQELPSFRQRIQNFSAGLGMCCISVIVWDAFLATCIRVLGRQDWVIWNAWIVAEAQVALVGVAAMSFAVAVVSFRARDRCADATGRFLRFVEVVDEMSGVVENSPISKMKLSTQYASLLEAGGEEMLNLPAADMRKMDDAFRISVLWASRRQRQTAARLLHLARVYDEDLAQIREQNSNEPSHSGQRERNEGLDDITGGTSPLGSGPSAMSAVLELALQLLEETEDRISGRGLRDAPYWAQLCGMALADGAVLGPHQKEGILTGAAVDEKVRDAYMLAKWKVSMVRLGSGSADSTDGWWRWQT
ncbi:hypothetical protein GBA65_07955 [Rubrobacter marinus]|uniref:Uncharacterized protein n=1 Tax=Rubrobacter marinus TaxID=2653852 RepID=A0A6G8PW80_9ACTN|nr:hypothetical protein [Rubrobacter marinus]QIN78464.1 hypothetical protein GBA65_07955 [Rubrobacter marinus]